jgi:cytochrome c-type biogenesis protein CcmH/NrfG
MRNRRLREAEAVARRAVEIAPHSPEAHLTMGDVLFTGGVFAKAGLEYKEALRLRPDWLPARIGLGNVAVEKRLIPLAVEMFEKATQQDPRSVDAWIGLGRAYYNQRLRWDKAMAAFQTAARLAPGRTDFYPYYSDALRTNYRFHEAEQVLRRRIAAQPNDARSHYLLALILLDSQRSPAREVEAEQAFRTSLRLEPDAPATRVRLAQLLLGRSRTDWPEAAALLERALADEPRDPLAMSLLARAYRRLGRVREAEAAERQAAKLSAYAQQVAQLEAEENQNPLNVAVHRKLAALYERGGELNKARQQREMIYMLEHHNEAAARGLAALKAATESVVDPVPGSRPTVPHPAARNTEAPASGTVRGGPIAPPGQKG